MLKSMAMGNLTCLKVVPCWGEWIDSEIHGNGEHRDADSDVSNQATFGALKTRERSSSSSFDERDATH